MAVNKPTLPPGTISAYPTADSVEEYLAKKSDRIRTGVATLSHNSAFKVRDLAEYRGFSNSEAALIVRGLIRSNRLQKVAGGYYPTKIGWDWIEGK